MIREEIQNLIDYALADGQVTDKERSIILKKALSLGEDIDEVEMILDAQIYKYQNNRKIESNESIKSHSSNKEGNIFKCPACGETVDSFTTVCISCGHEFRGTENRSVINKLKEELKEAEDLKKSYHRDEWAFADVLIAENKCRIIELFPIPNTKEDILEFFALCMPIATKKYTYFEKYGPDYKLHKAFKAKAEHAIIKGRIALKNDTDSIQIINEYAKLLKMK